jgi:uncharacterized protein YqeY
VPTSAPSLRDRLAAELSAAVRRRDRPALSALRGALAAIANAEAVAPGPPPPEGRPGRSAVSSGAVAGTSLGVGSTEAPRRLLDERDMRAIVDAEVRARDEAARTYAAAGQAERAAALRAESAVLREVLVTQSGAR